MSDSTIPDDAVTAAVRPEPTRRRRRRSSQWTGLLYVLPALALVTVFFLVPLGMTVWMSLHKWPLMGVPRFIGLDNYEKLIFDKSFWSSLWFTIEYTVVVTVALLGVALALAFIVQGQGRAVSAYRTIYFLPVVTGFASAALLWVWLSNVDTGLFSRSRRISG
nr:sugar ABC transporter permease [Marinicella sp. W31]MDC2880104.1 sugar ABC transporter permease [Marinicella sp. W31]